jgi:hypothetical protein
MTTTTDVSPPADDSGVTTNQAKNSQHRPSRLNQALAWVGIVTGGLFIVAAVFFSGFFLSSSLGDPHHGHMGPGTMDCCSQMKADEHMKPGAMMGPGGQMMPGGMMPGGMMGPAVHSPATPSTPRP